MASESVESMVVTAPERSTLLTPASADASAVDRRVTALTLRPAARALTSVGVPYATTLP